MSTKTKILVHLYLNPVLDTVECIVSSVEVKRRYVLRALVKIRDERLVFQQGKEVDERRYKLTYLGTKYVVDLVKDRHSRGRNRFPPRLETRMHAVDDRIDINITSKSKLDYILFKLLLEHYGARVGGVGGGGSGGDFTYRFGLHLDPKYKRADKNHRQLIKIWNGCYTTRDTNRNFIELVAFEKAIDHLHETGWFREYYSR